jgi:hypothetical protein
MNVVSNWIIACAFVFSPWAARAENVHGVLRVVKGSVQIKSGKSGEIKKARLGAQVYPKDVIITGKDARAKIVMVDNNEINVSPESQIEIQHYEYDPSHGKKDVLLNVIYGKVRSKVEQKYDGRTSKFQIRTPSAVAGVRGTDFLTSYNRSSGDSRIVTFRGKVEFGVPAPGGGIARSVFVTPGQTAVSMAGRAPTPPAAIPQTDLARLDNESRAETPAVTAPSDGNGDQRQPAADGKADEDKTDKDKTNSEKKDPAKGEGKKGDDGSAATAPAPNGSGKESTNGDKPAPPMVQASGGETAAARSPASTPGTGGSMLRPEDLAGNANAPTLPLGPATPAMPGVTPPPVLPTNALRPCDFCKSVIENGNQKVLIRIKTD